MSEFLTNEQVKEFVESGGIMKCMELIEKEYTEPQSMSPKYLFPTLKEMGYEKVVHCKDCIHRPRKHWEGDEYEVVAPRNKSGKRDYTCYYLKLHEIPGDSFYCGFGEIGEQEDVFKRKD